MFTGSGLKKWMHLWGHIQPTTDNLHNLCLEELSLRGSHPLGPPYCHTEEQAALILLLCLPTGLILMGALGRDQG